MWESYFPGKVEHIRTFQNMLAQEKGQDRMPENVTHQSLNQVESFVESFATASCTQVMASQKNGRLPGCILRAISDGTRSCSPRFSAAAATDGGGTQWTHVDTLERSGKDVQRMHS